MKKILVLFGLLDWIAIIKSFEHLTNFIWNSTLFNWMFFIWLILYFSLIFSGLLLLKSKKEGILIYYVQFPLKLIVYSGFSFGFILLISRIFPNNSELNNLLLILCVILEISRLALTLFVHRKYYSNTKT